MNTLQNFNKSISKMMKNTDYLILKRLLTYLVMNKKDL